MLMTTTLEAERAATALDPVLAELEATACPVLSGAAEAAREALLRLLDVLALVEPGAAVRAASGS